MGEIFTFTFAKIGFVRLLLVDISANMILYLTRPCVSSKKDRAHGTRERGFLLSDDE